MIKNIKMKKMGWTYLLNLTRNRKIYFSKQNIDHVCTVLYV